MGSNATRPVVESKLQAVPTTDRVNFEPTTDLQRELYQDLDRGFLDNIRQTIGIRSELREFLTDVASSFDQLVVVNLDNPNLVARAKEVLYLSLILEDESLVCICFQNVGAAYKHKNEPQNAIDYLKNAIEQARILEKKDTLLKVLNLLGMVYDSNSQVDQAVQCFEEVITLATGAHEEDEIQQLYKAHMYLANIHQERDQHERVCHHLQNALDTDACEYTLVQSELGEALYKNNQYSEAFDHLTEALRNLDEEENSDIAIRTYRYLAEICKLQKEFEEAEKYANNAYNVAIKVNFTLGIRHILLQLAGICANAQKSAKGIQYVKQFFATFENAHDDAIYQDCKRDAHNLMAELYEKQGNSAEQIYHQEEAAKLT